MHQNPFLLSLCHVDLKNKKTSCKETHTKIITKFYLILALWSKDITTKIKEGHTYSTHISATVFYTVLYYFFPSPPASTVTAPFTHTLAVFYSLCLIKHTLSNTIICKTHAHVFLQNAQSSTVMHTVGSCLSEAVTAGLWSSKAGVVGTVAVLEGDRAPAKHTVNVWNNVYDDDWIVFKWYIINYRLIKTTEVSQNTKTRYFVICLSNVQWHKLHEVIMLLPVYWIVSFGNCLVMGKP